MQMARGRPYQDLTEMLRFADLKFRSMTRKDWLEAFIHIPDVAEVVKKHKEGVPAGGVQSASNAELAKIIDRLDRMLLRYSRKFGHRFIPLDPNASLETLATEIANRYRNDPQDEMEIICNHRRRLSLQFLANMMAEYRPQQGDGVTVDSSVVGQKLPDAAPANPLSFPMNVGEERK